MTHENVKKLVEVMTDITNYMALTFILVSKEIEGSPKRIELVERQAKLKVKIEESLNNLDTDK